MSIITLDHTSAKPKYQQIMNSIIRAIDNNQLKIGDKIHSVNEVCERTGIAKKTVVQAFEQLKQAGIINSVKYKGYFVASRNTQTKHNIFVLFNNLTANKEVIYESIKRNLGDKGIVDIYFHHNNPQLFNTLIEKSIGNYTEYILMPMPNRSNGKAMQSLPKDKVFILDLGYKEWGKKYPSVCQYFEEDIYYALKQGLRKIKKYRKLILVLGKEPLYNLKFTEAGFEKFCKEYDFQCETIVHLKNHTPLKGALYIIIDDLDLVLLVKILNQSTLKLGKDIGIISYNETPIKEIVGNGISTISTDFSQMGESIIDMILNKKKLHLKNPFHLIDRNSF